MTFSTNGTEYRISFDSANNLFIATNAAEPEKAAQGVTIEQAVAALALIK